MKLLRTLAAPLVLASMLAACGDDPEEPENEFAVFAGTWTSTTFAFAPKNAPSQVPVIELSQLVGRNPLTVTITSDGNFTGSIFYPTAQGVQQIPVAGSLDIRANNQLAVDFTQGEQFFSDRTVTYSFTNNNRALTWHDENATYPVDWNQDGQPDPATLTVVLQKQ